MSTPKYRYCDCCGKRIPYNPSQVHMEYDGYVANCIAYDADNSGNPDFCYHGKNDKIFGLVSFNMNRSPELHTVVNTEHFQGDRCRDICNKCKIRFLEKVIENLKTKI